MAKMFYTIEEVCQKLGRSEDEIKEMVSSGQIQEFRDRDKLMFRVEQIDLLATPEDESGEVHLDLEASSSSSGLDLKDESELGLADSREGTGISVFDTDHEGAAVDASEQTQAGSDTLEEELSLESVGSGSGLLDLTRESDDTSLGAELLEEVYASDENIEIPAHASGLFEAAGAESPGGAVAEPAMAMPMMMEAYEGSWSGLGVGMLLGATIALACGLIIGIVGLSGVTPSLATMFADNFAIWAGGLFAITVIFGLIGALIGKASE